MSNLNISQLPAAAAISGSEQIPLMQSGITKNISINSIPVSALGGINEYALVTTIQTTAGNLQAQLNNKAPATLYSIEPSGRALVSDDNGKTLVVSGGTFTINTGLGTGFGVVFKGQFSYTGSATITDERYPYASSYTAALLQTGNDIYTIVGTKP